jgi:hypothetical protein
MSGSAQWELEEGTVYHWTLGSLSVWVHRAGGEWSYCWNHTDAPEPAIAANPDTQTDKPHDLPWVRVISPSSGTTVSCTPCLPDRPTVVKSEESIAVLPHTTAELFAPIPVWIAFASVGDKTQALFEAPTQKLHRRWFGTPMQGSLCYSVFARLSADRSTCDHLPISALCPVRIRNQSHEVFRTDTLYIQSEQLGLYHAPGEPWFAGLITSTEITTVTAADEVSFAVSSDRAKTRPPGELVARARRRSEDSWWKRGYVLFQRISNY